MPVRVVAFIEGGVLQDVCANCPVEFTLVDRDEDTIYDEPLTEASYPVNSLPDEGIDRLLGEVQAEREVLLARMEQAVRNGRWKDNSVQFPRLLSAVSKMGLTESQIMMLSSGMGIEEEQVQELLVRADGVATDIKQQEEEVARALAGKEEADGS